ncbi:hypothetical protein MPER_05492 [Moniliophthora perniciosa FA553]|nr:hypothetical protein MPER_05492 [Moniliophthora perniciosa FA553]
MFSTTVKVAVIGSGLTGLTAAYLLSKGEIKDDVEYEVHIFEKVFEHKVVIQAKTSSIPDSTKHPAPYGSGICCITSSISKQILHPARK